MHTEVGEGDAHLASFPGLAQGLGTRLVGNVYAHYCILVYCSRSNSACGTCTQRKEKGMKLPPTWGLLRVLSGCPSCLLEYLLHIKLHRSLLTWRGHIHHESCHFQHSSIHTTDYSLMGDDQIPVRLLCCVISTSSAESDNMWTSLGHVLERQPHTLYTHTQMHTSCLVSFPGLPRLQFLITCSMQNWCNVSFAESRVEDCLELKFKLIINH